MKFQRKWLNEYNANIRGKVGDELKKQNKMETFYWMMNQTEYIKHYLSEEEYLKAEASTVEETSVIVVLTMSLLLLGNLV